MDDHQHDHLKHHRLPGATYDLGRASHLTEHLLHMRLCGRSERTLHARRRSVVRLAEHLDHDPLTATYHQLYQWQLSLLTTSRTLVAHQTALVRPYFTYLHVHGYRADNPSALLPSPGRPHRLPRPMAEPKVMTAIATARPRLLPWLLLAGWSGLRAAEIAGLDVADFVVDRTAPHPYWVRVIGKGDKERHAPIPEFAWAIITPALPASGRAWRRERGIGPVTSQHVSQYCCAHLHEQGIPDTLHALRHRVGTLVYQETGDLGVVAQLLGHASLEMARLYSQVQPRKIAAAVNALPTPPTLPHAPRHLHVVDDSAHGGSA